MVPTRKSWLSITYNKISKCLTYCRVQLQDRAAPWKYCSVPSSIPALVGQSVSILDQLQFLLFQTRMTDLYIQRFSPKTHLKHSGTQKINCVFKTADQYSSFSRMWRDAGFWETFLHAIFRAGLEVVQLARMIYASSLYELNHFDVTISRRSLYLDWSDTCSWNSFIGRR
jgi:hypothetical protein